MGAVVEALAWEVLAVLVWLTTLSVVTTQEVVLAVVASAPCAALVPPVRHVMDRRWAARGSWLRWVPSLVAGVVIDTPRVLAVPYARLLGRDTGARLQQVALGPGGAGSRRAGHRALATGAVSATPSSVVVGVDERSGSMLVHLLASGPISMPEVVTR